MKHPRKIKINASKMVTRKSRKIVWLIAVVDLSFLGWASVAPLDELVRGAGTVVPKVQNQIVQNLEGGIVNQIFVSEGDHVRAKELVVKMDDTRFQNNFLELQNRRWALMLRLARLESESDFSYPFHPDPELVKLAPEHAAAEIQLFQARRQEFQSTVLNLLNALNLKSKEVEMLRSMAASSAIPQVDLIRAELNEVERKSRFDAAKTEFETLRAQEYAETLVELQQVKEEIRMVEDQLDRTDVRSPIEGVVNKVIATTIGEVVQPGDPLLEIISLEDELRVEGRIDPSDIGFVQVGMLATIKLTAFDFTIYGSLEGTVVHVGADTIIDEKQRDPKPYYEVFVVPNKMTLSGQSKIVEIRPGMQAQLEIHTGSKTVLTYLLKPLFKATEALSER